MANNAKQTQAEEKESKIGSEGCKFCCRKIVKNGKLPLSRYYGVQSIYNHQIAENWTTMK